MPNILHRLTIDAPPERVHRLAATREGIQRWWTGQPVAGDDKIGAQLSVYFDPADPAATFEVVEHSPEQVVWRCVGNPQDWIDARITYALKPRDDGGTTLLFSHDGWQQENHFMNGCSTNWAAYLMSLKSGAKAMASTPTRAARSAAGPEASVAGDRRPGRQRRAARDYWSSAPAHRSAPHEEAGR